jgi:hypothetical protein
MEDASLTDFPQGSGVFPPSDPSPDGLREWISETCRYLRVTPTEFAKSARLAASTLNRFLRQLDEATLSARTIDALLEAAKRLEKERAPDANVGDPERLAELPYLIDVPTIGDVALGSFHPITRWVQKGGYRLRLPVKPPFHRMGIGAFHVKDHHAYPVFPKNSLVIATAYAGRSNTDMPDPKEGDYVLVFAQSTPETKRLSELTIRRVVVSPSGDMWLTRINRDIDLPDAYMGPGESWRRAIPRPFALIHQTVTFFPAEFP